MTTNYKSEIRRLPEVRMDRVCRIDKKLQHILRQWDRLSPARFDQVNRWHLKMHNLAECLMTGKISPMSPQTW